MFAASKTDGAVAAAQADPFFNNVAALLNTSGTNGAQNNTFIDSSTNNFTITRNGNTTQGSFSPYGEDWSNYFDGTGDYLSLATNAAFGYGTGAFTIECWFNSQSLPPSGADYLFDQRTATTQAALLALISPSGQLEIYVNAALVISGGTFALNTWNHFALSRSGTTTRMFLNGVQIGNSYTDNTNYLSTTPMVIGARFTAEDFYQGYISNFRVIKGTALYTANFTPSTVPLQPVAGTSLLTCKDPNIVDDSANNFTITRNGDVSVQKFGPFPGVAPTTQYFSAFFDGNADTLTTPTSSAFNVSGNFTIEGWYSFTALPPANQNDDLWVFTSWNPNLYLWGDGTLVLRTAQTSGTVFTYTHNFALNTWYHIAVVKSGTSFTLYVNGTSVATGTSSAITSSAKSLVIGQSSTFGLNGYLSNFRVVNGQALYTSNFTPSTVPLTTTSQGAIASNVSLLTCQSSTFVDNSPNNFTLTIAGNTRPTAFAPFALTYTPLQPYTPAVFGGSMYFDGNGDSLTAASNAAFALPGDYTFETWLYPTSFQSSFSGTIFNIGTFQTGLFIRVSSTVIDVIVVNSQIFNPTRSTFIPTPNCWYHLALVKSGTTYTLYINGVSIGTATNSSAIPANAVTIGVSAHNSTELYQGYLSGMRLVKGSALYTSNFVPQNTPPLPVTNTSLLLNATNAGIYDAAGLNDFETVGNAQVSTSVKVYGTSSMAFDGNGDSLDVRPIITAAFSQRGRYTIEAWIYPTNLSVAQYFYSQNTTNFLQFAINSSGRLEVDRSGVGVAITSSNSLTINTWQYVALVSDGTNLRLYINGTQSGSTVSVGTQVDPSSAIIRIGAYQNNGGAPTIPFYGFIQDFRITTGIARYTTNFTPPSAPLPTF